MVLIASPEHFGKIATNTVAELPTAMSLQETALTTKQITITYVRMHYTCVTASFI
jgi:hypothetical protein